LATSGSRTPKKIENLSPKQVVDYLLSHPAFLRDHPELVSVLAPPTKFEDGVLDMQHFMIEKLQAELAELRNSQRELLSASRVNLSSQERIHAAVLAVIEARTLEDIGRIVAEDYRSILDVTTSSLCFEGKNQTSSRNIVTLDPGTIGELLGERSILLRHDVAGDTRLFGDKAKEVRSDALVLIDLGPQSGPGLLALGSHEADRFHPGQGTELLGFMARAITGSLRAGLSAA
jgi:uncharacterized protein YigA (DUF484 family)